MTHQSTSDHIRLSALVILAVGIGSALTVSFAILTYLLLF